MTDEPKKRGRPKMTDEQKATARAAREAAKAEGNAGHNSERVLSEEEKFDLLVKHEPRIAQLEAAAKEATDKVKAERDALAKAFGGAAVARKRLNLFRHAQTPEGAVEARQLIDMHQRVAAWQNKPVGYVEDMFAPSAAQQEPEREAA